MRRLQVIIQEGYIASGHLQIGVTPSGCPAGGLITRHRSSETQRRILSGRRVVQCPPAPYLEPSLALQVGY